MIVSKWIRQELGDLLEPLGVYTGNLRSKETLLCAYIDFKRFQNLDKKISIKDRSVLVYGKDLTPLRDKYNAAYKRFIRYSLEGFLRFVVPGFVVDVSATLNSLKSLPFDDYATKLIEAHSSNRLRKAANSAPVSHDPITIALQQSVNRKPLAWVQKKLTKKTMTLLSPLFSGTREENLKLAKKYIDIDDALIQKKQKGKNGQSSSLSTIEKRIARELKKMGALEVAKLLTVNHDSNDIAMELNAFYDAICAHVNCKDNNAHVAIIDPSAYFVSKWLDDAELKDVEVSFVYSNSNMNEYRLIKRYLPFVEPGRYEVREQGLEYRKNIKILTYRQMACGVGIHGKITCFAINQANKQYSPREQNKIFSELNNRLSEHCNVLLFTGCSSTPDDTKVDAIFKQAHYNYTLELITLLPQGIERSTTPRRKMFVSFTHHKNGQFSLLKVPISRITLSEKKGCLFLERNSRMNYLPLENNGSLKGKSVRAIHTNLYWRGKLNSARKNRTAERVDFSPELRIKCRYDYNRNGGFRRVTACFEKRKHTNDSSTGSWISITSSEKSNYTFKNKKSAYNWVKNEYPFERKKKKTVRHFVSEEFNSHSSPAPLPLRTIWYTNSDCENDLSGEEIERLKKLMSSDIGDICFTNLTYAAIRKSIIGSFPDDSAINRRKYLSVLNSFLEAAVKRDLIPENPIEDLSEPENCLLDQDPAFAETRSPLIKRHFTQDERQRILQAIHEIQDVPLRLACFARFLMGIDANSLCALCWEDFRKVPIFDFYQFRIYRQMRNESEYTTFKNTGNIRGVPCSPLLSTALVGRKTELKTFFNLSKKELEQYPMFLKTNNTNLTDQANLLSPSEVSKALKQVLLSLDIPDEIFQIPDRIRGTIETNLSYYGSDIFREDFKFRATEHARMIDGELRTMLGLTLKDTASKHYIDFDRDDSQFAMYRKLVRMEQQLHPLLSVPILVETEKNISEFTFQESSFPIENTISAMEITIPPQGTSEPELTITSKHGHSVKIIRYQKRRK